MRVRITAITVAFSVLWTVFLCAASGFSLTSCSNRYPYLNTLSADTFDAVSEDRSTASFESTDSDELSPITGSEREHAVSSDDVFVTEKSSSFTDTGVLLDGEPFDYYETDLSDDTTHDYSNRPVPDESDARGPGEATLPIPDITSPDPSDNSDANDPRTIDKEFAEAVESARDTALDYLKSYSPDVQYGSEWIVIPLCLSGRINSSLRDKYLLSVKQTVAERLRDEERSPSTALDRHKATENARVILSLLSLGADPEDVDGHDLRSALCDVDWVCNATLNCPIYALIALDACGDGYEAQKDALVDYILSRRLDDGGWALSGTLTDPDVTAMALQALCHHRSRSDVLVAVSKAIQKLSSLQLDGGGFRSWGRVSSESISQVLMALCAWGIDPSTDPRFVKNGTSALEALLSYRTADGFADTAPGGSLSNSGTDLMATEQAALALLAYERFVSGGGSIFEFD